MENLKEEIIFKPLKCTSLKDLANSFNLAFSDYEVAVNMSCSSLKKMMEIRSVDLKFSYGAFSKNLKNKTVQNYKMPVSFILCGVRKNFQIIKENKKDKNNKNEKKGRTSGRSGKVAYDSGTGTIPAFRRLGIGKNLLKYTIEKLQKAHFDAFLLEVLENNQKAIQLYESQGFTRTRKFLCYNQKRNKIIETLTGCDLNISISYEIVDDANNNIKSDNKRYINCKINKSTLANADKSKSNKYANMHYSKNVNDNYDFDENDTDKFESDEFTDKKDPYGYIKSDIQVKKIKSRNGYRKLDFDDLEYFIPSWQNSSQSILNNFENIYINVLLYKEQIIGYGTINQKNGDIQQVGISKKFRNSDREMFVNATSKENNSGVDKKFSHIDLFKIIILDLARNCVSDSLSFLNVEESIVLNEFLRICGFNNFINQYEMIRILKD